MMYRFWRGIYSLVMYLLIPLIVLRLFYKSRRLPEYRRRILERFCLEGSSLPQPVDVWLHAVSLGEVVASIPLLECLLHNKKSVLITTTTPTGAAKVKAHFGASVMHRYLPYDMPDVVARFFKRVQPKIGVVMETELWPNLVHKARSMNIPLMLANGRLSPHSYKKYVRIRFFIKETLKQFTALLVQSQEDAQRYLGLGAPSSLLHQVGNMKYDVRIAATEQAPWYGSLKSHIDSKVVIMAASTHQGEEDQILSSWRRLQAQVPNAILFIAPRHPERFQEVYHLAKSMGFRVGQRTELDALSQNTEVLIVNSTGELMSFYGVSDYAFVGGSLVPVGGHNALEAIAMNVPVLFGPNYQNCKAIVEELYQEQALRLVNNGSELVDVIIELHKNEALKKHMMSQAQMILERNKGSVNKHWNMINSLLIQQPVSA